MEYAEVLFIAGATITLVGVIWYFLWCRPLRRLANAVSHLAAGSPLKTSFLDSPRWFRKWEQNLESLSNYLREQNRVQAEQKFNLNAIMASMVEGVLVVDERHVIHLVNEELIKLFDLKQNPQYRTVLESLREAEIELILRDTLQSGQPRSREIMLVRTGTENKPVQVEVSAVPIRDDAGAVQGAVAVFHDVSHIKQLESVRREFVSNVSHELRTPLSIFRGYLETLLDNPELPPEEVKRALETMRRHSDRLNALVEDLLTLTRMESRKVQLQVIEIHLDAFISQVLRDYNTKIESELATVTLRLAPNLPPFYGDPLRLSQVFINLLDNSIVYSKPPKQIEIGADVQKDELRLWVRDNGIGIPPADLPRVFERFYRVDKARSRDKGGTGLGLSIVKHIAQLHGGSVSAESEFGHWTQITLRLPLTRKS